MISRQRNQWTTSEIPKLKALLMIAVILPVVLFPVAVFPRDRGEVVRVVDGDTLVVKLGTRSERVRLIGIDTPESRKNSKAKRDAARSGRDLSAIVRMGKQASAFVKSVVSRGDTVTLEYDVDRRDRYGRILAYVYLSDGRMLNELIVRSGYGSVMTYPPNVKYSDKFKKAYRYARQNNLGLWAEN